MFDTFQRWLDLKLHVDAYQLCADEVISTGLLKRRIRLSEIRTWQSFYIGSGVPSICIEFSDGRKVNFSDQYEQLFQILSEKAKDRELPFFTA